MPRRRPKNAFVEGLRRAPAVTASAQAATNNGLQIIAEQIEDNPNNVTRFAVIGEEESPRTGKDRTAIIIAHRLSTVEIADRVLVLEHGQVVEDGSPQDLIAGGSGQFSELHDAWIASLA